MKQMTFNHMKINYNPAMHVFTNDDTKGIVFVSKGLDEIHAVVEVSENNNFKIHPRWNVNFFVSDSEITVDLNYCEEEDE
ncbi:hypothetical protein P4637_03825 [Halalkalibacterium halodurans]|uniref:hypothetical protein n=1 Tax=Halalkalibacterium halodurans TaxID=86665 RepID=UPI002E202A0A|nr:hypothetical protein [Halalkalibacterium halodurans]MED4083992.1 hypothetical protein [Halalkalibacterium halodurans]MED4106003.1 hypothetical protein [Halalkalibacterium halodurans]MED4107323.1 hypothetical protein [Halalkalibacterium halodurans]MED4148844.1 hypothetical protein [Halalkalibacterium halodurans]